MKKIILLILMLLSIIQADIFVDKTVVVNDARAFTYYCIDNRLWLEFYIKGSSAESIKFQQVFDTDTKAKAVGCNVINNKIEIIKK